MPGSLLKTMIEDPSRAACLHTTRAEAFGRLFYGAEEVLSGVMTTPFGALRFDADARAEMAIDAERGDFLFADVRRAQVTRLWRLSASRVEAHGGCDAPRTAFGHSDLDQTPRRVIVAGADHPGLGTHAQDLEQRLPGAVMAAVTSELGAAAAALVRILVVRAALGRDGVFGLAALILPPDGAAPHARWAYAGFQTQGPLVRVVVDWAGLQPVAA